jgi:hypothetical protein
MSLLSRFFDDAQRVIDRMERAGGRSGASTALREELADERAKPAPDDFIPLEIPAKRPTPSEARAFLGRWKSTDPSRPHEIEVRASGDTIIVHDVIVFPSGDVFEADNPVIQVTADGALEWGLPWFRGIAALLVLHGSIGNDGVLTATREPRGWVPLQAGPAMREPERFTRVPNP